MRLRKLAEGDNRLLRKQIEAKEELAVAAVSDENTVVLNEENPIINNIHGDDGSNNNDDENENNANIDTPLNSNNKALIHGFNVVRNYAKCCLYELDLNIKKRKRGIQLRALSPSQVRSLKSRPPLLTRMYLPGKKQMLYNTSDSSWIAPNGKRLQLNTNNQLHHLKPWETSGMILQNLLLGSGKFKNIDLAEIGLYVTCAEGEDRIYIPNDFFTTAIAFSDQAESLQFEVRRRLFFGSVFVSVLKVNSFRFEKVSEFTV